MQETFWRPRNVLLIFGFILSLAGAALWAAPVDAQGAPPGAHRLRGQRDGGGPAGAGRSAGSSRASRTMRRSSVLTQGGKYQFLKVTGPAEYLFRPVTFHLKDYDVQAAEIVPSSRAGRPSWTAST